MMHRLHNSHAVALQSIEISRNLSGILTFKTLYKTDPNTKASSIKVSQPSDVYALYFIEL